MFHRDYSKLWEVKSAHPIDHQTILSHRENGPSRQNPAAQNPKKAASRDSDHKSRKGRPPPRPRPVSLAMLDEERANDRLPLKPEAQSRGAPVALSFP
jgi:hypothetical protein